MQLGWERFAVTSAALFLFTLSILFHPPFHLPGTIGAVLLGALSLPEQGEGKDGERKPN